MHLPFMSGCVAMLFASSLVAGETFLDSHSGWARSDSNGEWYKWMDVNMTWTQGLLMCEHVGAYLASATYPDEYLFLKETFGQFCMEKCWTSGLYLGSSEYYWYPHSEARENGQSHWAPGNPGPATGWQAIYITNDIDGWQVGNESEYGSVICSYARNYRLVDGPTQYQGLYLYRFCGEWFTMCNLTSEEPGRKCAKLGLPADNSSMYYLSAKEGPIYDNRNVYECNSSGLFIEQSSDAVDKPCTHAHDVALICTPSVRLVNGSSPLDGRLEIYNPVNSRWYTVCNPIDVVTIRSICAYLGFAYAGGIRSGAYGGQGSHALSWTFRCIHPDLPFRHCLKSTSSGSTCTHENDIGIVCSEEPLDVTGVSVSRGPISGGTSLTLNVTGLRQGDLVAVRMGSQRIDQFSWNSGAITIVSPPHNVTADPQTISLVITNGTVVPTYYTFTYTPDPVVTRISPLTTIQSGGTKLTVYGQYFDSVADPVLKLTITARHKTTAPQTGQAGDDVTLSSPCDTTSVTFSEMECTTPRTAAYIAPGEEDLYLLYIGLKLDGVPTYINLSQSLPGYGRLDLHTDPTLYPWEEEKLVKPGEHLVVEGESMTKGCGIKDYTANIGESECEMAELTENELLCLPNDTAPPQTTADRQLGRNRYYLMVQVGYSDVHQIGIVRFGSGNGEPPSPFPTAVIVGGAVAGVVIINLAIILCVCITRRCQQKSGGEDSSPADQEMDDRRLPHTGYPNDGDEAHKEGQSGRDYLGPGDHHPSSEREAHGRPPRAVASPSRGYRAARK